MEKLISNLILLFGNNFTFDIDKKLFSFTSENRFVIEYYYSTDCTTFPYDYNYGNSVYLEKLNFLISSDCEFANMIYNFSKIYVLRCHCNDNYCKKSFMDLKSMYNNNDSIEFIQVNEYNY